VGVVLWIASLVWLLAMNVTVRRSEQPTLVLLVYFGFLAVLAMADHGLYHPGAAPAGHPLSAGPAAAVRHPGPLAVQLALVLVASTAAFGAVEFEKWILRR
jgi:hypothetical protein